MMAQKNVATTPSNRVLSAEKKAVIDNLLKNMVYVEGNTFVMGATSEQGNDAWFYEKPAHKVTLSSYYIGKYPVTQEEWEAVMGSNPAKFKGDKYPVEQVSWDDCQEFVRKLSQLTGKQFRLPTEAEWEFAARGGSKSKGYKYAGGNDMEEVGWFQDNSDSQTHPVGQKKANELGIYDMSGNVWEWCQDRYEDFDRDADTYTHLDPQGPTVGFDRVERGGGWASIARRCRVSSRGDGIPSNRFNAIGLRIAYSK